MTYLKVKWKHLFTDEPIWLYSELDTKRWELRKIEVFPDGTLGYACLHETTQSTRLSVEPIPPLSKIAADPQFEPAEITKEEFESIWNRRQ